MNAARDGYPLTSFLPGGRVSIARRVVAPIYSSAAVVGRM
jgi:hypothetical protein